MSASDAKNLLKSALATLRSHRFGFLTTVGGGLPHTRLVQHISVDGDATIWIPTSPRSRKTADALRHPVATYAVEDRASLAYVSIEAHVHLVDDESTRLAMWWDGADRFFPDGPLGDDLVLIRLRPTRIEQMSFAEQIHPEPYGLVPAVIELSGDAWTTRPAVRNHRLAPDGRMDR